MGISFEPFSAEFFLAKEAEFLSIAADIPGDYWQRAHFLADLPEKWELSFAVLSADSVIGYAILSRPEITRVHLHHFMVHVDRRGDGRGSKMIEECVRRAAAASAQILSLKVAINSNAAQRFYVRHGFSQVEQEGDYFRLEYALP
jgi:ribosomal protein S18 acetylase RimI-like enzyme